MENSMKNIVVFSPVLFFKKKKEKIFRLIFSFNFVMDNQTGRKKN